MFSQRSIVAAALTVVILVGCGIATPLAGEDSAQAGRDSAQKERGSTMTEAQSIAVLIETEARKAVVAELASGAKLSSTPAMVANWPPGNEVPLLRVFFYPRSPAPTGMVAFNIRPPRIAVTLSVEDGTVSVQSVEKLNGGDDATQQVEALQPLTTEALNAGTEALVAALEPVESKDEAAAQVRAVYATWVEQNPVIANAIRPHAAAFMEWLDEK